jgi:hypothetical protein
MCRDGRWRARIWAISRICISVRLGAGWLTKKQKNGGFSFDIVISKNERKKTKRKKLSLNRVIDAAASRHGKSARNIAPLALPRQQHGAARVMACVAWAAASKRGMAAAISGKASAHRTAWR